MEITATLSQDEIKEILTEHIETKLKRTVISAQLDIFVDHEAHKETQEVRAILRTEDHPPLPKRSAGRRTATAQAEE